MIQDGFDPKNKKGQLKIQLPCIINQKLKTLFAYRPMITLNTLSDVLGPPI
jgi:hypothetical protein